MLHDRVIKLSKARVHVCSDSVLYLGKMHPHPAAMERWREQLENDLGSEHQKEFFGIDGEPFEFEWTVVPGHDAVELLREIQMKITIRGIKPEEFEGRIIFMSMCTDIGWSQGKENSEVFFRTLRRAEITQKISEGTLDFSRFWC